KRAASRRTAPIPTTDCLPSSPQGGATGSSVPGPAGSGTASSLRLSPCCTLHHGDSPPGYPLTFLPTMTVFPPLPWPDCHTPPQPLNICTKTVHLFISIYFKLLSISIFTVFISYVSYLIYNFYCHFHLYFTCTLHIHHICTNHICTNHHYCCLLFISLMSYTILYIFYLSIFILPLCTYSAFF